MDRRGGPPTAVWGPPRPLGLRFPSDSAIIEAYGSRGGAGNTPRHGTTDRRSVMHPQSSPSRLQFVKLCECGCGQPTCIGQRGTPNRYLHGHSGRRNTHKHRIGRLGYSYVYVPLHPAANCRGYVPEHRLVIECVLGRYLEPTEAVHHRDGNKRNNRPANLQVVSWQQHMTIHQAERKPRGWSRGFLCCAVCGTIDRKHAAHGICVRCYAREWARSRRLQIAARRR